MHVNQHFISLIFESDNIIVALELKKYTYNIFRRRVERSHKNVKMSNIQYIILNIGTFNIDSAAVLILQ